MTEFESTNRSTPRVSFKEALLKGQAPDKGLYFPVKIPSFEASELDSLRGRKYDDIAFEVLRKYVDGEIPEDVLSNICRQAYDFDVPLEKVRGRNYVMRLDRGPTASFKDFAARCMARMMSHFLSYEGHGLLILTATSGDTGSAVANAFHGLENVEVVVLFPEGEVTERQRKQMTTLSGNVTAVAIEGKFDDCQALVKKAFSDTALVHLNLSSANSINIGRLLPQSVYYIYAYLMLSEGADDKVAFSVPSGNFGDLMGGTLAARMGLPVSRFIVATNENDEFPKYLKTGIYEPLTPSRACISNAMNVGHPSNLARLFHLYGGWLNEQGKIKKHPDIDAMRRDLWSMSVSDALTRKTIKDAYTDDNLLLEPHGAVGWAALREYLGESGDVFAVSLETADPAKFPEEIISILGFEPPLPKSLTGLDGIPEKVIHMPSDYGSLRKMLLKMK